MLDSWPKEILASPRVHVSMGALDLRALAALISLMDHYVIGSTGPLHVASALGIRTTSPFCPLVPINSSIWGNAAGTGCYVRPNAVRCQAWTDQAPAHHHCDFRGEITAENLWTSMAERQTIQL